jgi:Domain of unknown function (DU1801)
MTRAFSSDKVAAAFDAAAPTAREGMLILRSLIFETADELPRIGRLEEALRWGQPAYLTPDRKAATTIRLGVPKTGGFAIFVHCGTSLIADYSILYKNLDRIEGTRAILFTAPDQVDPLRHGWLIRRALTYHL